MRKAIEKENFCDLDKTIKTSSTVMCWKWGNIYHWFYYWKLKDKEI